MAKRIVFLFALVLCASLYACGTTGNTGGVLINEPEYEVTQIIDSTQFAYLTKEQTISLLGEPTRTESKKAGIGDFYLFRDSFERYEREILFYENVDKSEYQLLLVNDKIYSFLYWSPKHADDTASEVNFIKDTDIMAMFGVAPSESINELNTSVQAAAFESVSDTVWRFDVSFIDRASSTFQLVVITFDITSHPIEAEAMLQEADTSRTVYVTPSGKKYHYDADCGGENSVATTLNRALGMGKSPCEKCVK